MPSLSKLFKSRDSSSKKNKKPAVNGNPVPPKPQWSDAWIRTRVDPEEVAELLSGCTQELKSRALDLPFLLLPFRPTSDPSAARTFVRNYFFPPGDREILRGDGLMRELRLTEPMVLASVMKWCWSRLPGGVVTWEAYELFKIGEKDSHFARDAFAAFMPMSVDSDARKQIIFDFFDLMAAIAAHGKSNGLGGRKLSRYAGWWAFEHYDTGKGFNAGYKGWASAADATSHLFFAYLRSLSPDPARGTKGIIGLPISLQQLVHATEYPPEAPTLMFNEATKVVMIVDMVSPTPYALLRRAKNFEYRDDDSALQQFASYDDPVRALTDECRRVLKCISSTNQSTVSTTKASTSLRDASWSRFEDVGFGAAIEESDGEEDGDGSMLGPVRHTSGLRTQARSVNGDLGRPTTPSWADFLSSGFVDENGNKPSSSMLLPPDKVLPSIQSIQRGQSSQSHRRNLEPESALEPGELASIENLDLDDSFWWVWISSLAGEEPTSRKAVFGRCALIETVLSGGKWMIMEEQVKGAAPEPAPGAYIAEKKGFFGFTTRRGRLTRRKSALKKMTLPNDDYSKADSGGPTARTNIAPDQQARIQAAARELQRRHHVQEREVNGARRGRYEEISNKTNSVMTLQPMVMTEASQAMKWASQYDKKEVRAQYLGDDMAGRGSTSDLLSPPAPYGIAANESSVSLVKPTKEHELPPPPEKVPLPRSPAPIPENVPLPMSPAPQPENVSLPMSPAHPLSDVNPLSKLPTPPPRREDSLPKTPSPPPIENPLPLPPSPSPPIENPLPLPPSPPSSNKVTQAFDPTSPTAVVDTRTATPGEHPATALPQPPSPEATPPRFSDPQSAIPRKAVPSSPPLTHAKLSKKRNPGTGIKGIFGSRRPKEPLIKPPTSPSDETSPAIAAARAALAAKNRPQVTTQSVHQAITQEVRKVPNPAPSKSPLPAAPPPMPTYQAPETPAAPGVPPYMATVQHPNAIPHHSAPQNRRYSEDENLSRVDTNEREQADREFSTFDQGPLLEQPAFVPPDSPVRPEPVPSREQKSHQQALATVASVREEEEADEPTHLVREISPVQDRWAQIRKNAAERAAKLNEEQSRPSEVKTDDGETSGEETIESRVARIKARVAELTGNIEPTRR